MSCEKRRNLFVVPVDQYWAAYIYADDADALCAPFRRSDVELVRGSEDTFNVSVPGTWSN